MHLVVLSALQAVILVVLALSSTGMLALNIQTTGLKFPNPLQKQKDLPSKEQKHTKDIMLLS
jgi:hypothetical protein